MAGKLENLKESANKCMDRLKRMLQIRDADQTDFENIQRRKRRIELITVSLVVCGIEFCYAAETAFVTPLLLKIGLPVQYMTMVWCLSPLFGFFACPILGSLSDRCNSKLGRRRPFIILYSIGIVFGLIFVSYGHFIGTSIENALHIADENEWQSSKIHPFVIVVTIIGVFMLDFDCDACQSPSRAYLVDVTSPEDHSIGLSTFTIMAGAGGFFGYLIGAVPWEDLFKRVNKVDDAVLFSNEINETTLHNLARNQSVHVQIIFTVVLVIFVACASLTLTSFKEIRMKDFHELTMKSEREQLIQCFGNGKKVKRYGEPDEASEDGRSVSSFDFNEASMVINNFQEVNSISFMETLTEYFRVLLNVPAHILVMCLTNFFCWMSLVCYSLYFTDFVAQEIFGGSPDFSNKNLYETYENGVRFGSFCMALYSISCSFYSYLLNPLIQYFQTKKVYIVSQLIYSFAMLFLALNKSKWIALLISPAAGIMYSTLFTIPYILIASYHSNESTDLEFNNKVKRGLGADISLVGSMVFLAQFILSLFIGSIVKAVGTTTVVIYCASLCALCGAITANFITYS